MLRFLALYLPPYLSLSDRCTHIKGQGGLKATVADVQTHLPDYRFVMRTDVKGYYASIDHEILLELLSRQIKPRFLLNLLCQYLKRTVHRGGLYRDISRGISRGCPLSPLIGAYYPYPLPFKMHLSGTRSDTRSRRNMSEWSLPWRLLQRSAGFRASSPKGKPRSKHLRCYEVLI